MCCGCKVNWAVACLSGWSRSTNVTKSTLATYFACVNLADCNYCQIADTPNNLILRHDKSSMGNGSWLVRSHSHPKEECLDEFLVTKTAVECNDKQFVILVMKKVRDFLYWFSSIKLL